MLEKTSTYMKCNMGEIICINHTINSCTHGSLWTSTPGDGHFLLEKYPRVGVEPTFPKLLPCILWVVEQLTCVNELHQTFPLKQTKIYRYKKLNCTYYSGEDLNQIYPGL